MNALFKAITDKDVPVPPVGETLTGAAGKVAECGRERVVELVSGDAVEEFDPEGTPLLNVSLLLGFVRADRDKTTVVSVAQSATVNDVGVGVTVCAPNECVTDEKVVLFTDEGLLDEFADADEVVVLGTRREMFLPVRFELVGANGLGSSRKRVDRERATTERCKGFANRDVGYAVRVARAILHESGAVASHCDGKGKAAVSGPRKGEYGRGNIVLLLCRSSCPMIATNRLRWTK